MSTYYFLACDKHREAMMAASTAGDMCAADADVMLGPFVLAHCECQVRIVPEWDDEVTLNYERWHLESMKAMIAKARDESRF